MQYKCETCHDTGDKNRNTGDFGYLDCQSCDMPMIRKALNDFVNSLGPTHPEDIALAIHQRALAMAPKQKAAACSECDGRGFTYWGEGTPGNGFDVAPEPPEQECCQVCGGSGNAPPDSELIVAAPAVANGVPEGYVMVPLKPTPAMIKAMAESRAVDDEGEFPRMIDLLDFSGENKARTALEAAYVAAVELWPILAAAGPDAALIEDAMRYRHLRDDECEAKAARMIHAEGRLRFESYGATLARLIDEARAALSGAKGN